MKTLKISKKWYSILTVNILLLATACDSFVAVDLPKSQLTQVAVFEDNATANAALNDIYAKIRDKGILTGANTGISNQLANYTDEMVAYGNPTNPSLPFYNNALLPTNSGIADYWNSSYNQIYSANALLEGIAASTKLTSEHKKTLQGEALFIRALVHFYLANLFGDIPYIKTTDYQKNAIVSRLPIDQVYNHTIEDIKQAIALLPESYSTTERIRANKWVAKSLLARVYLYHQSYDKALQEANEVIHQSALFVLEEDLDNVFLLQSKETIWQLQAPVAGQNTQEGAVFIFETGPPSLVALSDLLVNSFSNTDQRKTHWIKAVTDGNAVWYHANKYKERNFTGTSKEYSIVMRLAELYLIRAEAKAQLGSTAGAIGDLNLIRFRAGLSATTATTKEAIITALIQERRWEFFTEHGHRFFDLKRYNQLDAVLSGTKSGWNTHDRLFPIPQIELSTNPNLRPQNSGY